MLFMSFSFKSLRSLHPCFHSTQYSQADIGIFGLVIGFRYVLSEIMIMIIGLR